MRKFEAMLTSGDILKQKSEDSMTGNTDTVTTVARVNREQAGHMGIESATIIHGKREQAEHLRPGRNMPIEQENRKLIRWTLSSL